MTFKKLQFMDFSIGQLEGMWSLLSFYSWGNKTDHLMM